MVLEATDRRLVTRCILEMESLHNKDSIPDVIPKVIPKDSAPWLAIACFKTQDSGAHVVDGRISYRMV